MALKSFRFALGTAESPRSGLWHLRTQEDDVHLEVHGALQPVAFTGYKAGRWRITTGEDISRWTRPKDFRPGWARGPDLLIPGSTRPLRHSPTKSAEPVTWLAPPHLGSLARFTLLFAAVRSGEYPWRPHMLPGTSEIIMLTLRSVGAVYLCRRDELDDDPEADAGGTGPPALAVRISADQAGVPSLRESYLGP
jgi:hypothetical protein